MAKYAYERLSAQDAGFLWAEKPNQPMHVGAVAILDAEPLRTPEGCLDIDRYRSQVESVLHWIPRYRQRLEWTPIDRWPVWVDDRQFDLNYHIRHIALPRPGTLAQLKELAGRITARALDRRHALWEIWVIEGVSGGEQYALINKIHHCMIDGAAGADLAQILMSPSPQMPDSDPVPYMPRPVPTPAELFRDSVSLGLSRPFEVMRKRLDAITRSPLERTTLDGGGRRAAGAPSLERRLRAFGAMMEATLGKASATPLNGELSPHRRVEWITMPLDDVKECGKGLRSTINDVVLATVTEAVRRYFFRRRVDCRDLDFRISAPVSVRKDLHDRRQGNHVSSWVVSLPIALTDPLEQLAEIQFQTEKLKNSEAALAIEALTDFAEWLPASVLSRVVGGTQGSGPINGIVTNVPGPQFPLYIAGSRLHGLYPMVPLLPGCGLGIALFSYEGKLCWGFNGDYELVPDLHAFTAEVVTAFEALRAAAVTEFLERRTSKRSTRRSETEGPSSPREDAPANDAREKSGKQGKSPASKDRPKVAVSTLPTATVPETAVASS